MKKLLPKYAITFAISTLVISCILMVFILYEFSLTKQRFATELTSQSVEQIKNQIDAFFGPVNNLIISVKDQFEYEFNNGLSDNSLNRKFIPLIDHFPQLSSMGIADNRGYEFDILPDSSHREWLNREVWVDNWGDTEHWRYWNANNSSVNDSTWTRKLSIDPRERTWFKGAIQEKDNIFWTLPYKYSTNREYGITASILLPGTSVNKRQTILAFDLTIRDIIQYVNELKLTDHQKVFLLTGNNKQVIALNKNNFSNTALGADFNPLQSPADLDDPVLLKVLKTSNSRKAFKFETQGENWWGVLTPYHLSPTRTINIVSVLPEKDFAIEINRTQISILGSFSLIILLTVIIVMNHNKLHRTSALLTEKNTLISEQKRVLSSEVHHRVKNNLAVISAFLELDILDNSNNYAVQPLARNQQRIKVIALVQEEAYKSKSLEDASVSELISAVISNCKIGLEERPDIHLDSENTRINVNQALSYALLLNEIVYELLNLNKTAIPAINIKIQKMDNLLLTSIRFSGMQNKTLYADLQNNNIVNALISQLDGETQLELGTSDELSIQIEFKLKKKKGIVGNTYFNA